MKNLLFLLMLIPTCVAAMCAESYLDKDGQSQLIRCGSNRPETQCYDKTYWNGEACVPVEIIKLCESQGGEWEQVQLRIPRSSDKGKAIINMCVCPNKKVWDGKTCRSDVPLDQQCTNFFGDGTIRMTKEFFGSDDCPQIPQ